MFCNETANGSVLIKDIYGINKSGNQLIESHLDHTL